MPYCLHFPPKLLRQKRHANGRRVARNRNGARIFEHVCAFVCLCVCKNIFSSLDSLRYLHIGFCTRRLSCLGKMGAKKKSEPKGLAVSVARPTGPEIALDFARGPGFSVVPGEGQSWEIYGKRISCPTTVNVLCWLEWGTCFWSFWSRNDEKIKKRAKCLILDFLNK